MAFKLIVALTFVAVARAGVLPAYHEYHAAPQVLSIAQPSYGKAEESYDHNPKYEFSYAVHDEHTGDIKSHTETRDGDLVKGEYSLIDSDGHKRIVQYTADHDHGFNAIVHREPVDLKSVAPALLEYASGPAYHYEHAPTYTQQIVKSVPVALEAAPAHSYYHH